MAEKTSDLEGNAVGKKLSKPRTLPTPPPLHSQSSQKYSNQNQGSDDTTGDGPSSAASNEPGVGINTPPEDHNYEYFLVSGVEVSAQTDLSASDVTNLVSS